MKLHTLNGALAILQAEEEVDYTANEEFAYGLLYVETGETGSLEVQLRNETSTRIYDLSTFDVNGRNLLVKKIGTAGTANLSNVHVFR